MPGAGWNYKMCSYLTRYSGIIRPIRRKPMLIHTLRVAILLTTLALGIALTWSWRVYQRFVDAGVPASSLPYSDEPAEYGSLRWRVQQAKSKGERELTLGVFGCGMRVSTLDEALANYSVAVVQPIEKRTYVEKHGLRTWYKFKVLEVLSQKPLPSHSTWSSYAEVPADLFPLSGDEVLMQGGDGSARIDGVAVIQHTNSPDYALAKKYLLFLEFHPSRGLSTVPWPDEIGIFTVDSDGFIKATDGGSYDLKGQMGTRFGNSLERLRDYLEGGHREYKKAGR